MPITRRGDERHREALPRRGPSRPHWHLTDPALLLLLTEGPSHGYELLRRLRPMLPRDTAAPDAGGLYRRLRALEDDGLLDSSWAENPGAGPRRRVYELTDSGRATLDGWASLIAGEIHAMSGWLVAYHDPESEPEPEPASQERTRGDSS